MNKKIIITGGVVVVVLALLFLFKDKIKKVVGDSYDLNKELDKINAKYDAKIANKALTEAEKMQLEKERNTAIAEARKIATERQKYLKLFGNEAPVYYSLLQLTNANTKKEQEDLEKARVDYTKQVGVLPAYSLRTANDVYNALNTYKAITDKNKKDTELSKIWETEKRKLNLIVNKWFDKPKDALIEMEHLSSRDTTYVLRTIEARYKNLNYSDAAKKLRFEIAIRSSDIWYSKRTKNAAKNILSDYIEIINRGWQLSDIKATGEFKPKNFTVLFSGKRV